MYFTYIKTGEKTERRSTIFQLHSEMVDNNLNPRLASFTESAEPNKLYYPNSGKVSFELSPHAKPAAKQCTSDGPRHLARFLSLPPFTSLPTTTESLQAARHGVGIRLSVSSEHPTNSYFAWALISVSRTVDEETPLLDNQSQNTQQNESPRQKTPLPWRQFSILLLLRAVEPLSSQVIAPFLPQV